MTKWNHNTIQKALNLDTTVPHFESKGVSIDSRTLEKGNVFVALVGESGDGHEYVKQAVENGAAALIVHKPILVPKTDVPVIQVQDTLNALQQMGVYARKSSGAHIIGVTGSVGKTTTKEIMRQVMAKQSKTSYSVSSYNNQWGVPLSLARMEEDSVYGIFEIGMNHEGEIRPLAEMVRPHMAIITHVCESHIGNMKTLKAIAKEKASIFYGLEESGIAIINSASAHKDDIIRIAGEGGAGRILTFGGDRSDDAYIVHYEEMEDGQAGFVTASVLGAKITYFLSLPGIHAAIDSLSTLIVMRILGLDMEKVIEAMAQVTPALGRGRHYHLSIGDKKFTLIDDSYNANPTSMRAGLQVLKHTPVGPGGRRIVILGDMLELGDNTEVYHKELAPLMTESNVDIAFSVGKNMQAFHDVLPESRKGVHTDRPLDVIPEVERILKTGDVLFIKGSLGSKVRSVAQEFLQKSTEQKSSPKSKTVA